MLNFHSEILSESHSMRRLVLSFLLVCLHLGLCSKCAAINEQELQNTLPDKGTVEKLAKSPVNSSYMDSLCSAAESLSDYSCFCQLFTVKDNKWKDYGGAQLYFKQKGLLRAEIKSSGYNNGSIVVIQPDGKIRGKGGGGLSLLKMTLQPDSRTLRLPTGYSLVKSDFLSLSRSLKEQVSSGIEPSLSAPVKLPAFREPVLILAMRKKNPSAGDAANEGFVHVVYLNPNTRLPIAWNTFKDGKSDAFVFFEQIDTNKGLSMKLFSL